jgi:hypothetical protein
MTKRTGKTGGTQGAGNEAAALTKLLAPLVDGMTTTWQQLLSWVQSAGLVALAAVFRRRRCRPFRPGPPLLLSRRPLESRDGQNSPPVFPTPETQ